MTLHAEKESRVVLHADHQKLHIAVDSGRCKMQPTPGVDTDQQLNIAAQGLPQAIAAMHQPGAPANQLAAANDWLEKFQETELVWKVLHTAVLMHASVSSCPKSLGSS